MGGVLGAIGAIQAGKTQQAIFNEQARQGRVAAKLEREVAARNAARVEFQRQEAVATTQRENKRFLAGAEAISGATGVETSGSLLDVLSDLTLQASLREQKVDVAGRQRKQDVLFAGEMSAFNLMNRANLDVARGGAARQAAFGQALTSLGGEFMTDGIFEDLNPFI